MKKVAIFFAVFIIAFLFFKDCMVQASVKVKPAHVTKEKLVVEAESLRKNLLDLFENHKQAATEFVSSLGKAKKEQVISEDFLQSEMEKILDTQSVFFWNKRELARKNFFKMSLRELKKEVYGMCKAIEAVEDATAFFAERTFLLKKATVPESERDIRDTDKKIFRNIRGS